MTRGELQSRTGDEEKRSGGVEEKGACEEINVIS